MESSPPLTDNHLGYNVSSRHPQNDLDCLAVVVASITSQGERTTDKVSLTLKDGLNKILQIVGLLEYFDLFAQA